MKEIQISYPSTMDEYKDNLRAILLLATVKNDEELKIGLKVIGEAISEEQKLLDNLLEYLENLQVELQSQYTCMCRHEPDEDICAEFYADMMLVYTSIRQKIYDLWRIKESVMKLEHECYLINCPNTSGDNIK